MDVKVFLILFCACFVAIECENYFGCELPEEPLFGQFVFNRKRKSYTLECDPGFYRTGSRRNLERRCINGAWRGDGDRECRVKYSMLQQCPIIYDPNHGRVLLYGRKQKDKARFVCDEGYILDGSSEVTCLPGYSWSGSIPVCSTIATFVKEKFVDSLSGYTATSVDGGPEGRLSIGKSGLDIVFVVDVSSSISENSLDIAKGFMKKIVDEFGVSPEKDGGVGTRFATITFSHKAETLFNLDDADARSVDQVKNKIDSVANSGGGTNIDKALDTVMKSVYLGKIIGKKDRKDHATRAVFLITDAEHTAGKDDLETKRLNLKQKADGLRAVKFEIFTLGVGRHIDRLTLSDIASSPYVQHVFIMRSFDDLKKVTDTIAEKNIDHSVCGVPGKSDITKGDGLAVKGAWPWIGWLGARDKTCGGALLGKRWFVTLATCVSEVNATGHVVEYAPEEINLYLGDLRLYKKDDIEVQVPVAGIYLHDNYTGDVTGTGVRDYDIALLDLGDNDETGVAFTKFLKPICFPYGKEKSFVESLLISLKNSAQRAQGYTAGWGHAPDNIRRQFVPDVGDGTPFMWGMQKQNMRAVQMDRFCEKRFGVDPDRFFCVGNQIDKESANCRGDIGGPYMAEMSSDKRFAALGLALKTDNCLADPQGHYSIFLDLTHVSVSSWLNETIDAVENPPPTTTTTTTTTAAPKPEEPNGEGCQPGVDGDNGGENNDGQVECELPNQNGGAPNQNGGVPNQNDGAPNQNDGAPNPDGGAPNQNGGPPDENDGQDEYE